MPRRKVIAVHNSTRALPLFLVGAGLLILGAVAGMLLLREGGEAAAENARPSAGEFPSSPPAVVNYPAPALSLTGISQ